MTVSLIDLLAVLIILVIIGMLRAQRQKLIGKSPKVFWFIIGLLAFFSTIGSACVIAAGRGGWWWPVIFPSQLVFALLSFQRAIWETTSRISMQERKELLSSCAGDCEMSMYGWERFCVHCGTRSPNFNLLVYRSYLLDVRKDEYFLSHSRDIYTYHSALYDDGNRMYCDECGINLREYMDRERQRPS